MKRILLSKDKDLQGGNFLILDGELQANNSANLKYIEILSNTKSFKNLYKDNFITISKKNKSILFSSHYKDLDDNGRQIFYMYLVDKIDSLEKILEHLMSDSKEIGRSVDHSTTLKIVMDMEKKNILRKKLNRAILFTLFVILFFGALFFITKNSDRKTQNIIKNEQATP